MNNMVKEKKFTGYDNGGLILEGQYLNGEKMEKEKNMILMVN